MCVSLCVCVCSDTQDASSPPESPEETGGELLELGDLGHRNNDLVESFTGPGYRPLSSLTDLMPIYLPSGMVPLGEWSRG